MACPGTARSAPAWPSVAARGSRLLVPRLRLGTPSPQRPLRGLHATSSCRGTPSPRRAQSLQLPFAKPVVHTIQESVGVCPYCISGTQLGSRCADGFLIDNIQKFLKKLPVLLIRV